MPNSSHHLSNEEMPPQLTGILSEKEKQVYRELLVYADSIGWEGGEIVAFSMKDGTTKFSLSNSLNVLINATEESVLSERLLVVVSVAYLEDQIRILLERFLTHDDISDELLDPHRGTLSSLMPMAAVAFSLGLLAKEWYETLKRMAQLRNKFAHIPYARKFEDLTKIDSKASGLIDSLTHRYKELGRVEDEDFGDFRTVYGKLFHLMYNLMQFSIDHIASLQHRESFDYDQIAKITMFSGFTPENMKKLINDS